MNLFVKFFGCVRRARKEKIRTNKDRCDFYVQDFIKIYDNIIPHFDNYPLFNIKELDFLRKQLNYSKLMGCGAKKKILRLSERFFLT